MLRPEIAMRRHIRNYHLLGDRIPEIIDTHTPPWIARIPAIFYVPIGYVRLTLPPGPEFVGARGRISNAGLDNIVSQGPLTAL